MQEDLQALIGDTSAEKTPSATVDMSAFFERLNTISEKLDKIIELSTRDVKIDESNNAKVDIAEAEGKINEHEEYEEEGKG